MSRYVIESDLTKNIRKLLKKYGEVKLDTPKIRGVIKISGIRKYSCSYEIDIEFKGEIYARKSILSEWIPSEDFNVPPISKIKVNRFIRKTSFLDIKHKLLYFGIDLVNYKFIKKVKLI